MERIQINPDICFGKPTIRGTRYSVEWLLELMSSGMSQQEILDDYEDLEPEDFLAVSMVQEDLISHNNSSINDE